MRTDLCCCVLLSLIVSYPAMANENVDPDDCKVADSIPLLDAKGIDALGAAYLTERNALVRSLCEVLLEEAPGLPLGQSPHLPSPPEQDKVTSRWVAAANLLGHLRAESGIPCLLRHVDYSDSRLSAWSEGPFVHVPFVGALISIGRPAAEAALSTLLDLDSDHDGRLTFFVAVIKGCLGEEEARRVLEEAARDLRPDQAQFAVVRKALTILPKVESGDEYELRNPDVPEDSR